MSRPERSLAVFWRDEVEGSQALATQQVKAGELAYDLGILTSNLELRVMDKNRLETLSDGIIAIVITIMVLDLKVSQNPTFESYLVAYPAFLSYALSFVFVGLYWSSHHHLFYEASKVNNRIIWVNMLGLFWLSLIPFTAATMGENSFASITVTIYAVILVLVTISYLLLVNQMCVLYGAHSAFAKTFNGHFRSYATIALNSIAAFISLFGAPRLAFALLVLTALMWFIPNHRFGTTTRSGRE